MLSLKLAEISFYFTLRTFILFLVIINGFSFSLSNYNNSGLQIFKAIIKSSKHCDTQLTSNIKQPKTHKKYSLHKNLQQKPP